VCEKVEGDVGMGEEGACKERREHVKKLLAVIETNK
jgi:hypothetical protein